MLYSAAVKAARDPHFFGVLGVPDTLDGRFDLVALFTALVIERLRMAPDPGPALAQAVFDAMFSDMDVTLREMGVGDLSVGKKVRAMWEGFHGRALSYGPALHGGGCGFTGRCPRSQCLARQAAEPRGARRTGPPCPARPYRSFGSTLESLAQGHIGFPAP